VRRLAIVVLIVAVVAAAAAVAIYVRAGAPYQGYSGAEQFVDIPPGSSTKAIGDHLVAGGVVRDPLTFRFSLLMSGQARALKAGEYRFDHPMTPLEVIGKIARGDVYVIAVTFPEGLTLSEMAAIAEMHGIGSAAAFSAAAKDTTAIRTIDPAARSLEGYLFPETYRVNRRTDPARLVGLMVERFSHVLTPELRRATEARGLSIHQLVTLASLVEKETARPEERPVVAAVYLNRFRIGMALQCDPTLIYALQREGKYNGNLRRDDLAFDSPYNTYRYPGLPPGPIASPGKASLEATAHPADVDYLYFVSRNDGSHAFASSLADHNRNVQKYQVEYFRSGGAGGAGPSGGSGRSGRSGRAER
jgi:UPF0755 protein